MENDDKNKIRIRNEKELASRRKCFLEICDIFEKNDIFYFIQAGTLLGAYREKDFIKWDWDVEISLFEKDFINNYEIIKKELIRNSFKVIHEVKSNESGKIDVIKEFDEKSTVFEIVSWSYNAKKKEFFRWKINIPEKFLINFQKIYFLGREFNCPSPIELYLEHQYGDWKTPNRTSNKNIYLSKTFYKEYSLIKKIKIILKKVLDKICKT